MDKYEQVKVTPSEAFAIYVEKYPETTVKEVKLENKSGQFVYEVEGYDDEQKYELKIDPTHGDILELEIEFFKGKDNEITKEATEKIDSLVKQVLEEAETGTTLYDYELHLKDRRVELAIRLSQADGQTITKEYNVKTGELIRTK